MESIGSVWQNLNAGRRTIVILASLAVFATVLFMAQGASNRSMSLLYANLEPATAGDVVGALEQQGVQYEVRGASIFVASGQRDQLRLTLAAQGLPANSAQGYELLDALSGFGTTSQMFDAAYWRAKEGELARTILASPHIQAARVHISSQRAGSFRRDATATAAVTVSTTGGVLSGAQANALRYLVASSVSGLAPDNVAVIDGQGGLITSANEQSSSAGQNRADELRARAERLLEARVGPGNAVVEVSVDMVTETVSIMERRIDPESRIAISTETEERTTTSQDSRGGDVTVASNLPAGDGAAGDGSSARDDAETRSVTNYEISETSREVLQAPGAIRRLTVAVLVNEPAVASGDDLVPRDAVEMEALRALVASAVGLDEARGDQITVQAMPFEPVETLGTEGAAITGPGLDVMQMIQLGVLAAVALILGLFVVRPILASNGATAALPAPADATTGLPDLTTGAAAPGGFDAMPALPAMGDGDFGMGMGDMGGAAGGEDDPVSRLRRMIDEREEETIQILQSWIEDPTDAERA